MRITACPFEHQIVLAVKTDTWRPELLGHVESCPDCRDTLVVAKTIRRTAISSSADLKIPVTHRLLWIRAQFTRKQERLSKLDLLLLVGLLGISLAGIGTLAIWKWQTVRSWLSSLSSDPGSSLPLYLIAGCAAVVWFLTEELFMPDK